MRCPSGVSATGGLDRRSHFDTGRVFRPGPLTSGIIAETDGDVAETDGEFAGTDGELDTSADGLSFF
jgi:hypothetical protein